MRSKKGLILMLALVVVLQSVIVLSAEGQVKTKTVVIESTKADESNLSREINIPNLKKVVSITTSTGNVTHNVNGEKITINVNGGKPTKSVKNLKKYSKEVKDYITSSSNSFATTKEYNRDGYKGVLSKDGSSSVISGSYIPMQSKEVTVTKTYSYSGVPSTIHYNQGGYSGDIKEVDTTSKTTQVWEPGDSLYITGIIHEGTYSADSDDEAEKKCLEDRDGVCYLDDSFTYNGKFYTGYSGHLYPYQVISCNRVTWGKYKVKAYHRGTLSKPGEYVDQTEYYTTYSGIVTKPALDTRVYRQNYKGIAYKEGFDNYYKYETTIKYIDNSAPTLNLLYPKNKVIRSSVFGYNTLKISGTVKDIDIKDILTVKYQLSTGATGDIQTLTANGSDQSFNADVNVSSLKEGDHKIYIWVEDNQGAKSNEISRAFSIDKTPPVITINPYNTEWTNQNITVTATVDKGALNQESYTFTENGSFTFIATDVTGNVTKKIVTITNIDKELPTMTIKVDK